KWVFPIFFKIVDKRQAQIDESNRVAVEASKHAEKVQEETEKLLKVAREEAKDIVNTAREEATGIMSDVEAKSKQQAEHLIDEARDEITREVETAKKTLHNEMVDLVMAATGKVLEGTVDAKVDKAVVAKTLKELK
ncbi:MAG: F0F1 ATP synthase subunit B, partial [Candidatus Saccharimonas sp.]